MTKRIITTAAILFALALALQPIASDAAVEVYKTQSKRDFLTKVYADQAPFGIRETAAHGRNIPSSQVSPTGTRICSLYDPTSYITWWSLGGFDSPGNNSMAAWDPATSRWERNSANYYNNSRYNYLSCSTDAAPDASLTANKTSIARGESVTLTWRSQYGQIRQGTCTAENFSFGAQSSGTGSQTYVQCGASGGLWNPFTGVFGGGGSSGFGSCYTASGGGAGSASQFGGSTTVSPAQTTTYTYSCTNANGTTEESVTVTVASTLTGSCSVSPASAAFGQPVTWTATASGGAGSTVTTTTGGGSGVWVHSGSDVQDFACPLTDMTRGGYNNIPNCSPTDPSGTSCSTIGTQCKYKYVNGCSMNTELYTCQGSGGASVAQCSPQAINNYNPTCNANQEQTDFSCPDGYRVEVTEVACRGYPASNTRPFSDRATCVPCDTGGGGTTTTTTGPASYTFSWSGSDGLSGTGSSVSKSYTTAGIKTASVRISSGGESIVVDCSNAVSVSEGGGPGRPGEEDEGDTGGEPGTPGYDPTAPRVRLTADDTDIKEGETTMLRWTTANVTSCSGTNFSPGTLLSEILSGVLGITPLQTTTYSLDCANDEDQHAYDSVTVRVDITPELSLSAAPSLVRRGESATLTWSGGTSQSCAILGPGLVDNRISGSARIDNIQNQGTYTLSCTKRGNSYQKSVNISIIPSLEEE